MGGSDETYIPLPYLARTRNSVRKVEGGARRGDRDGVRKVERKKRRSMKYGKEIDEPRVECPLVGHLYGKLERFHLPSGRLDFSQPVKLQIFLSIAWISRSLANTRVPENDTSSSSCTPIRIKLDEFRSGDRMIRSFVCLRATEQGTER